MSWIDPTLSRRQLLATGARHTLAGTIAGQLWWAELRADDPPSLAPLNRFPRMVQEYYVQHLRRVDQRRQQALSRLRSKEDAEAYVQSVRRRIRQSFGPAPEKTPLEPQVTGVIEHDAYRVEKLVFQSRPKFLVSANLYVPKGRDFPLPGVIGTCGHSATGKAAEAYQAFAQGLARMGYVVLIYDPIGQGERLQYPDENLRSKIGVGVREHLLAGNQQYLVGEFLGAWRAWDGIRALDYLLTRDEVDPQYVGVTGNSGGGTMTTWLCGVEDRWTMAAPSCFVTSFRRNLENELPADTEQCPPRALALDLDHEDFLAALAPKPIIILAKEKDYFDVRGTEAAFNRLRQLYRLLGAEQDIALYVGPTAHGYSQENRQAMYRWFNGITEVSAAQTEPQLVIENEEALWAAPRGQVSELGSRTVPSCTREASQALAQTRAPLRGDELRSAVRRLLKLAGGTEPAVGGEQPTRPPYRILRPGRARGYPQPHATTYAVETEAGIHAIVYRLSGERLYSRPPTRFVRTLLYVAHQSSDAELRSESLPRELIEAEGDAETFACDVRGIGESRPDTCGEDSFLRPYGSDYFYAAHALMLDRPYLAQRTHDLLVVLDWLRSLGREQVHLAALGWGTLPATFAALLSPAVVEVTLKHPPTSYADIAEAEQYDWPLAMLLPGVLKHFDLPDCYETIQAEKKLTQIEPRGATL